MEFRVVLKQKYCQLKSMMWKNWLFSVRDRLFTSLYACPIQGHAKLAKFLQKVADFQDRFSQIGYPANFIRFHDTVVQELMTRFVDLDKLANCYRHNFISLACQVREGTKLVTQTMQKQQEKNPRNKLKQLTQCHQWALKLWLYPCT